jgi:hypothetical protein
MEVLYVTVGGTGPEDTVPINVWLLP